MKELPRFEPNREATTTSAEIRWDDDKGHRYVSWTEPKGRGAVHAIRSSVAVTAWLRSKRDDAPRPAPSRDHTCCAGPYISCIECRRIKLLTPYCKTRMVLSFVEPVTLNLPEGKSKRVEHDRVAVRMRKPLPFKRKFWCSFSAFVARLVADRAYWEKSFSSMPPQLRRLLRFGPLPTARMPTELEQFLAATDKYNILNDIDKSFDALISEVVR